MMHFEQRPTLDVIPHGRKFAINASKQKMAAQFWNQLAPMPWIAASLTSGLSSVPS